MSAQTGTEQAKTRPVLLYRPSLDLRSGAGQLMHAQLLGLRAAGVSARLACERGAFRFFLRTGVRVSRLSARDVAKLQAATGCVVVDHGLRLPDADVVFVHNLATEARLHVQRADWDEAARAEAAFFHALQPSVSIVANSRLVKSALIAHFALPAERIVVHHPGFRADRFAPQRTAELRTAARRALRVAEQTPLLGFVTSGDFGKRGLDLFLTCAEQVAAARPDARFLVVGSKSLPDWARRHPLVVARAVQHRPKGARPELWCAALDLFVYAARFEEFGLVVAEAQALGIPVLTSRRVGAAECLSPGHERWLLDSPEPASLAAHALALLADGEVRRALGREGAMHATAFDQRVYVRATLAALRAPSR